MAVVDALLARPRLLVASERAFLRAARRAALAGRLTEEQGDRVARIAATVTEPTMA